MTQQDNHYNLQVINRFIQYIKVTCSVGKENFNIQVKLCLHVFITMVFYVEEHSGTHTYRFQQQKSKKKLNIMFVGRPVNHSVGRVTGNKIFI